MRDRPDHWLRRYPPLVGALVSTLLAILVLPSALNIPQSNPTQTLEFAPIPPEDDNPPPPEAANLESLSLGNSSTAPAGETTGGDGPGTPPPPPPPLGVGERPVTKRCVGNPPRQTDDPMAPPCVAHFEGDNFGATYQGVTGDEVVVLIYADPIAYAPGPDQWPSYWDLGTPPEGEEPRRIMNLRAFQSYFNSRFQTYGRFVRFVVHVSNITASGDNALGDAATPENRAADAADDFARFKPFAVMTSQLTYGNEDVYIQNLVERGVMSFGVRGTREKSIYDLAPGLIWSYFPTVEIQTDLFASYVCTSIVGRPVSAGGNGNIGEPRVLGMLSTREEGETGRREFARQAKQRIEDCGGEFEITATYRNHGNHVNGPDDDTEATRTMSQFQSAGVTSVVYMPGWETATTAAAANLGYRPEWIVAGDGWNDGNGGSGYQEQSVWQHARAVTNQTFVPENGDSRPCDRAILEASPDHPSDYRGTACNADNIYNDFRQLFTGIQVAGPRLEPETIERGFRAIPSNRSPDPATPACFYNPGDYTCVKDATVEWWDAGNGQGVGSNDGCWRMTQGGARYYTGIWPNENLGALETPDDPCNNFAGRSQL